MKTYLVVFVGVLAVWFGVTFAMKYKRPVHFSMLSPAEQACLERTNECLERAGRLWADLLEKADQVEDAEFKILLATQAQKFYESQVAGCMRMHESCVNSQ